MPRFAQLLTVSGLVAISRSSTHAVAAFVPADQPSIEAEINILVIGR